LDGIPALTGVNSKTGGVVRAEATGFLLGCHGIAVK
jgi:hypothetical protein